MTYRSQVMRQPGLVIINGFEQLPSLLLELQARPDLASQIKALEYKNDDDDEVEEEEDEEADDVEQESEAVRGTAQAISQQKELNAMPT
jgi:Chromatin assembly factor 1 subunit A/HAND